MGEIIQKAAPLSAEDERLVSAYVATGRPVDDLPYSEDFERLCTSLRRAGDKRPEREILWRLFSLRKAGRLPRLGRPPVAPLRVDAAHEEFLTELTEGALRGGLGMRDRLPYTPEFDAIVDSFNSRTGRVLTRHDVWRLLSKLAK